MHFSRFTILAPIPGRSDTLAVQPLTRQAAVLSSTKLEEIEDEALEGLRRAGIVVASDGADDGQFEAIEAEYRAEVARTPTQLILVPTFGCNLRCTYCYQEAFEPDGRGLISPETLEALFSYLDTFHLSEDPKPYLTLFGGEPLVDTWAHHDRVERILEGARSRSLEVAVVTNGYDLASFIGRLSLGPVREVQITLDGPPAVHDARRPHASGGGSFERVVAGLEAALAAGLTVNLRVVVDRENLQALPALASFAEERGWLELPEERFKTQVGRNYDLFGCASRQRPEQLFDRLELWTSFAALAERHSALERFHRPRLHGMRQLAETGVFPAPNFDACPAAKKEWAFGPDGIIYGCTATVGHPEHRLGRYAPTIERDEAAIARLRARSTLEMPGCLGCALAPVCGGGCAALAMREKGDLMATDCRPVRELLGLGASYYRIGL
jgi:uncharacterized protein